MGGKEESRKKSNRKARDDEMEVICDYIKKLRKPYLVACSGFINQEIKNKAIDSGFDLVIEQPLNVQTLRNHIIPKTVELKNQNE